MDNLAGKGGKKNKKKAPPPSEKPAKKQKKAKEKTNVEKGDEEEEEYDALQVNPAHAMDEYFQVLVEGSDVYEANLSQINLSTNSDKFYQLQLLVGQEDDDDCYVCAHWGRTGSKGQSKQLFSGDKELAKKDFAKHFKSKTGAPFSDRLSHTAKPNK